MRFTHLLKRDFTLKLYILDCGGEADMKKNMNNSAALTEDERRKMRKAALIKMLAMGVFVVVVMIFGSMHMITK